MKLKNITVQIGAFHDHWLRNGTDNPSVLIAAVTKYHYDFICLMDEGFEKRFTIKKQVEEWIPGFKVHLGEERIYDWGHAVTVSNNCTDFNLENQDYVAEFLNMKKHGGIVALAHIGYNKTLEEITKKGVIDSLIDNNIVDAVQIENAADYEYIKHRSTTGQKLPLISGWDSHMLNDSPGIFDCVYNESVGVPEHFDHSSFFRTIVFAADNSLEEIKKALQRGESVLEDISTGELYGSKHLIELLLENGYAEKIKELDSQYNSCNLSCKILHSGDCAELKMSKCGVVMLATDSHLTPQSFKTDDNGVIRYENIPMPVAQNNSYLPICLCIDNFRRYWAVKVENSIQIDVLPKYTNGKTYLCVYAKKDFEGDIIFEQPYKTSRSVSAKMGEELCLIEIGNNEKKLNYKFCAKNNRGEKRTYNSRTALLKIPHKHNGWEKAEKICIDSQEFCGGFGSIRPYPGKDVFSITVSFLWDSDNLYVKYDITDRIYIAPPEGAFMYTSDSSTLNIDPLFKRSDSRNSGCEMILGFPNGTGRILCTHIPRYENGERYIDKEDNCYLSGELTMENTENGRIVMLKLPWNQISPKKVKTGDYMGITVGGLNDEGSGLVDNMQWPWPAENGTWLFPSNWGVMVLID